MAVFLWQSQNRRKVALTWAYSPEQEDSAGFCDVFGISRREITVADALMLVH